MMNSMSDRDIAQEVIKNPRIRILLVSEYLKDSCMHLFQIFKLLPCQVKLQYNNTELTVKDRGEENIFEPTIRASSAQRIFIGPHYDLIVIYSAIDTTDTAKLSGMIDQAGRLVRHW